MTKGVGLLMKKAVFFDAGHTLFNVYERPRFYLLQYFCERCSSKDLSYLDWDQGAIHAEIHYQQSHSNPDYVDSEEFWLDHYMSSLEAAGMSSYSAYEVAKEVLENRSKIKRTYWLIPECIKTLQLLKRNYKLAVVSNWDGTLEEILSYLGIKDMFDFIADSGIIGFSKPKQSIFQETLDQLYVEPKEVIHIGDLYYSDVMGALSAGIQPLLYDPTGILKNVFDCNQIQHLTDVLHYLPDEN